MAIQTVVHVNCNNIIADHCHMGMYYLARIPVQIVLLNEGYHYQTRKFTSGKNRLSTLVCNGIFPVPSVLLHRGLVILSQFVADYLC